MKVGDAVKMEPMWKYDSAIGQITKITESYVVVKWVDIPGQWHYTSEQAKKLEVINAISTG